MQNTTFAHRSLAIVLGLAASGFAMQACSSDPATAGNTTTGGGGSGGSGGSESTTTSSTTTTTSTTTSTSTSTSTSTTTTGSTSSTGSTSTGSTGSGSSSSGGPGACIELGTAAFTQKNSDGTISSFVSTTTPNFGAAAADAIQLEFYGSAVGPGLNGEDKGSFDLANGIDDNYGTCARCFRVFEDSADGGGRVFFQKAGTLVVDATSDQLNGSMTGTITDLTLIEVTIDDMTFTSTPVPNGACLHIATAPIAVVGVPPPVVPAGWTCDKSYFADGSLCDCGCGAFDTDCADATVGSCDWCDNAGSCSESVMDCPGIVNPTDNSICTP